jgi:peptide/nickel transport system substrate-binding protein
VFARNKNFWKSGLPYVDTVTIIDFSDNTSLQNAVTTGVIHAAGAFDGPELTAMASAPGVKAIASHTGAITPFTMRVDQAPFNDVNVRQALRLLVGRPQLINSGLAGYGVVANDVFSPYDPDFDHSLVREQDIPQAKSLLKKAGQENLKTTLVTAPIRTGAVQMAQVLKQQASAAGITINLNSITSTTFFGPNYLKWPFAQDWWSGYPYLRQAGYSMVPGAPWDETHWSTSTYGARYLSLYKEALSTVDHAKQTDLIHELMMMDWNTGGYIIPAFNPVIVGQSPSLAGVVAQKSGDPWIEYRFRTMWLT